MILSKMSVLLMHYLVVDYNFILNYLKTLKISCLSANTTTPSKCFVLNQTVNILIQVGANNASKPITNMHRIGIILTSKK